MKEKNNTSSYSTQAWNQVLTLYYWSIRGSKYIVGFIMNLVSYLRYSKENKPTSTALKPYDLNSENIMKQFEGDIKKNGFVVVWKDDGVAYMEDKSKGFSFVSHSELAMLGEIAIHRNKDVVVIKPDKTYEIQTTETHLLGGVARMFRMQCLISEKVQEIMNFVPEIKEIREEQQEIREEQQKIREGIDEIRAHIGLPRRADSFAEMIQKNEGVQKRQI